MVSIIQISYFIIMVHPCRRLHLNENWHIHSSVFILLNEGWLVQLRKFIVNDKVGLSPFVGRTYGFGLLLFGLSRFCLYLLIFFGNKKQNKTGFIFFFIEFFILM